MRFSGFLEAEDMFCLDPDLGYSWLICAGGCRNTEATQACHEVSFKK